MLRNEVLSKFSKFRKVSFIFLLEKFVYLVDLIYRARGTRNQHPIAPCPRDSFSFSSLSLAIGVASDLAGVLRLAGQLSSSR